MIEVLVIFCIAAAGSIARLAAGVTLKLAASKLQNETVAAGLSGGCYLATDGSADPILRFGLTLACDGAIVLALVSALPGALALERTGLAFAMLCVGGLFGEMASVGKIRPERDVDSGHGAQRGRTSRLLAVALTLTLNLGFAVLSAGQGLIEIIPPESVQTDAVKELEPLVVVAQRPYDPLDGDRAPAHR